MHTASFEANHIHAHLRAALLFASRDTTKPHLACVRIEHAPDGARIIATDGHRMLVSACATIGAFEPFEVTLAIGDASALVKALAATAKALPGATVTISVDARAVAVEWVGQRLAFVAPDVTFPPWRQVLPEAPKRADARVHVPISARYLAEACDAFELLGRAYKVTAGASRSKRDRSADPAVAVHVEHGARDLDPILMIAPDLPGTIAIVMPRRESNAAEVQRQEEVHRVLRSTVASYREAPPAPASEARHAAE